MDIVNKILLMLKEQGKTQQDLTDYLGIKKSVFSSWKSGKSRSYKKYIDQIADFLQTSPSDLMEWDKRQLSSASLFSLPSTQKLAAALDEATAAEEKKPTAETVDELTKIFTGLMSDFTDEEVREIRDYVRYLRWKRYRAEV